MSYRHNRSEASFTLLETIIAIAIMTTVILELVSSQGNMVYFSNYTRRVDEATFLAKRLMSEVEYNWSFRDFSEIKADVSNERFEGVEDYTYSLSIKDWKFPFLQILTGQKGDLDGGEDSEAAPDPMGGIIEDMLTKVLGKEILKIAHVEVFWPEGAKQNSVTLTLLLTNQRKVDEEIVTKLAPAWEKFQKELTAKPKGGKNPPNNKKPPPEDPEGGS
jgi:type II secretory pathway pseudopilin PulG